MLRNLFFLPLLIILFSLNQIKIAHAQNSLITDSINPYCNGIDVDNFLGEQKIKNIEITTDNRRRWLRNQLGTLLELYSDNSKDMKNINSITKIGINWFDFRIDEKYKKKFKSTVIVNFEKGLSCEFRAKVRITGDIWIHLDWKDGKPLSSVHVELLDGHINSSTKFKLYLPKARIKNNEIFATSLFRELGFISPKTFYVDASINGIPYKYMFQEDIRKELIENSGHVEGPILEGDERFTAKLKDNDMMPNLSMARIINKNFTYKNVSNEKIALNAVSNLNLIYLQHHLSEIPNEDTIMARLFVNTDKFFLNEYSKKQFRTFEALMYGLDALHGLTYDDRRYYYDPINKYFLPIYYDGSVHIMNDKGVNGIDYISKKASNDAKIGSDNAIKLINNIDHKKFKKKLSSLGVDLSSKEYNKLIKKIINRLKIVKNADKDQVKFHKMSGYFSTLDPKFVKNRKLIFVNYEKDEFYLCSFNLDNCNKQKINRNEKDLANILSQRFTRINNSLIDSENLFVSDDINYHNKEVDNNPLTNVYKINDNSIIKYNDDIILNVDGNNRKIKIVQKSNAGRVVVTGQKLEGWNILFEGSKNIKKNIPNNYLGLTGCLTFLDIKIKDLNLNSKNSFCEDSINFIRVNGNIDEVQISDSFSDAFDLDFSSININKVEIKNAKNDCIDFSYGNYLIKEANISECGDKGISVGEKTKAVFKKVEVSKSNIAVAAKDSSLVEIENSKILDSPLCFAAYRKKSEFSGAKINIKKTNCDENQLFIQKGSKILTNI